MPRNDVGVIGESNNNLFSCLVFFVLLNIICVSFPGCGLDSTVFYSPPTLINGGNSIILTHNTANTDASFLGYEVYYRVYMVDSNFYSAKAEADLVTIASTQDTSLYTPASAFQKLTTGLGFVRLTTTSGTMPLLEYVPFTANVFTIQPIGSTKWYYYSDSIGAPTYLVRNNLNHDSFNSSYGSFDIDYFDKTPTIGPSGNICVSFFAVAYGFDFSASTTTIFSLPSLGARLSYTLPGSFVPEN